jgi:hypothetical protein
VRGKDSKSLLEATIAGDEAAVVKALDESHIHVTSNRNYTWPKQGRMAVEYALQCAIYLAYIYALNGYSISKEMTAGKGFADLVYVPFDTSETALTQIKEKRYFDSLADWHGGLLFVGVNYDEKSKEHSCKIERFVKE